MIYYRCKCGKVEHWSSMGVPRCAFCDECGTTPASGPDGHKTERTPHEMMSDTVETIQGPMQQDPKLDHCRFCYQQRRHLEGEPMVEFAPPPPVKPDAGR